MPKPEVSLDFSRLGPPQKGEGRSGTTQVWIGFLCNRVRRGNRAGAVGLLAARCCKFRPDPFLEDPMGQ